MNGDTLRILDTGTRPATPPADTVEVRHHPALVRRPVAVDSERWCAILDRPAHIVFYSRFAVRCMADELADLDAHRLWAVGPKTADRIGDTWGLDAEYPDDHHFSGLRDALGQCADPRPIVAFGLRGKPRDLGAIADDWATQWASIDVYESVANEPRSLREAFDEFQPHWLAVTSSRGARAIADGVGHQRLATRQSNGELRVAAIGPSTARTLNELELDADAIPDEPDRDAMLRAIVDTA